MTVAGVKDGKTYKNPPSPRCVGSDALSGVETCTVTVTKKGKRRFKVVVVATDLAGNTATAVKTYRSRLPLRLAALAARARADRSHGGSGPIATPGNASATVSTRRRSEARRP